MKIKLALLLILGFLGAICFSLAQENAVTAQQTATSTPETVEYHEVLRLGRGTVETIAWHPFEDILAVGGSQGIWLYTSQFEDIEHFIVPNTLDIIWSSDGTRIASSHATHEVQIRDIDTGELLFSMEDSESAGLPLSFDWSPDGTMVAIADEGRLHIMDVESGQSINTITTDGDVSSLTWNADGRRIAGGVFGEGIYIWDAITGEVQPFVAIDTFFSPTILWSPDGNLIAGVALQPSPTLTVWDGNNYAVLLSLETGEGIPSIAWRPKSTALAIADWDGTVSILDVASGEPVNVFGDYKYGIVDIAWSPDQNRFAVAGVDTTLNVWQIDTSNIISERSDHSWPVDGIAWQPNGNLLASVESLETVKVIKIWNVDMGEIEQILEPPPSHALTTLEWSPDGTKLVAAFEGWGQDIPNIFVWEMSSRIASPTYAMLHGVYFASAAWSPDGERIVSAGDDGDETFSVRVWDARNGSLLATIVEDDAEQYYSALWNPNGQQIATFSGSGKYQLWDSETYQQINTLTIDQRDFWPNPALTIWSPDGSLFASAICFQNQRECQIWTWDVYTGQSVQTFQGEPHAHNTSHPQERINWLEWDSSGYLLASAGGSDRTVRIWDVNEHNLVMVFGEYSGRATSVSWSPDSQWIASSSDDGSINIFAVQVN